MFNEIKTKSVFKIISWRIIATIITMVLVFFITGSFKIAAIVGIFEISLKILFYYFHEQIWNKINKKENKPKVIWFTGLSGAGKTTIAEELIIKLKKQGIKAEHLDGDSVRTIFPKTGFQKQDRIKHIKQVGYLASKLEANGIFVVASFISPYKESREFVRNLCNNFVEIHVSTPIEICENRDVKGLYKKARNGEIKNFTGINDPYEVPINPELSVDTSNISIEKAVEIVLNKII